MKRQSWLLALLLVGCATTQPTHPRAAQFEWFRYSGADPLPSGGEIDAGHYRNPILAGFYPDPSITRVGDDYYLVTSTFAYFPGIPVFHSRDLVSWRQIGNAIDRPDQLEFGTLGLSRGVFAPTIEYQDGLFYILNTCVDCGGNYIITARDPAGPWSDPVWLPDLEGGIDPSLFFDEDGSAWILNNGPPEGQPLYEGHRAIWIQRFDPQEMRTVGPRKVLVNGGVDISTQPIWIEGPHIFRHNGYYYLICAEGGTAEGHSQVVLRSREVTGPYEAYAGNPILTQRGLPRDRPMPITSAGHADFVETANGDWWATFLAVRPYEGDHYNTGREVFLMPVRWIDGWPRITEPGQAIPYLHPRPLLPRDTALAEPMTGPFTRFYPFDEQALGLEWMTVRNPAGRWYRIAGGSLIVEPRPISLGAKANPSFLARRQQHLRAQAEAAVRFRPVAEGDKAGLVAFQNEDFWYFIGISRSGDRAMITLDRRAGESDPEQGRTLVRVPMPMDSDQPLHLKIEADGARYRFFYGSGNGDWRQLGPDQDGRLLSTKTAGGFVGAVFGLHAYSANASNGSSR